MDSKDIKSRSALFIEKIAPVSVNVGPSVDMRAVEWALWILLGVFYIAGDILTTIALLELGGFESNPIVADLIRQYGYAVLLPFKLGITGMVAFFWYLPTLPARWLGLSPRPFRAAILSMFSLRGVLLCAWNSHIIYVLVTGSPKLLSNPF